MPHPPDLPGAKEALERLRPKLLAIPVSELRPWRFDAPTTVSKALKIAHAFAEDRPRFEATFKVAAFQPADFEDLELRAKALWQADVDWRQRVEKEKELPKLLAAAGPLKRKLFRAADYLWGEDDEAGLIIAEIRSGTGYLDLADDLMALANLFDARWGEVAGRTLVEEEDLGEARAIATAIAAAYGGNPHDPDAESLRDLRTRAFHYLYTGVEEVRAAAAYVHRNDPVRLADYPSLFAWRRRRKSAPSAPPQEERTPAPEAPTPADDE